jgi:hypothetical protein
MAVLTRSSQWLGVAFLSISFVCLVPTVAHVGTTWDSEVHPIKNVEANIDGRVVKGTLIPTWIGDWRLRDDGGAEHIIDLNSTVLTFEVRKSRPDGFAWRRHAPMIALALVLAAALALLTAPHAKLNAANSFPQDKILL